MYYVYVYLNPLKPGCYIYDNIKFDFEPFYIGKGKNYRLKQHLSNVLNNRKQSNPLKVNLITEIINSDQLPIIIKYYDNLTDYESSEKEKYLINIIGRIVTNNGPLTNILKGGEYDGLRNHPDKYKIYKRKSDNMMGKSLKDSTREKITINHQTDEYRKYMSNVMKNYYQNNNISNETKYKISSKLLSKKIKRSDQTKKKIGDANRNRKHTKKSRKNMSDAHIGIIMPNRTKFILISPINEEFIFYKIKDLHNFVKINNMSIRLIKDNINKGKIKIKRTSILTKNTENWQVLKQKIQN